MQKKLFFSLCLIIFVPLSTHAADAQVDILSSGYGPHTFGRMRSKSLRTELNGHSTATDPEDQLRKRRHRSKVSSANYRSREKEKKERREYDNTKMRNIIRQCVSCSQAYNLEIDPLPHHASASSSSSSSSSSSLSNTLPAQEFPDQQDAVIQDLLAAGQLSTLAQLLVQQSTHYKQLAIAHQQTLIELNLTKAKLAQTDQELAQYKKIYAPPIGSLALQQTSIPAPAPATFLISLHASSSSSSGVD